jgi:RNA polymerase sigma-70 factor (ECF subfamily)
VEAKLTEEAQRVMADAGGPDHGIGYDERLRLVLLCAHPSLAPESAAALTLRLVVGVSTEDIARLFLVPTSTMAARLTRARKRLARASFELPDGAELEARLRLAGDVAYLAFTAAYAPGSGKDVLRPDQAAEAIRLARVLQEVAPPSVEIDSLLALMLLQHSRRDARVDHDGGLVLLPDQDRSRWQADEIAEALALLTPWAHAAGTPYLLQALIAAEHAIAASADATDWTRVARHYRELEELTGSPVVRLNRAVAVAEADGPQAGLALLEGLELPGHRLPAVRGQLLLRLGRDDEAYAELHRALDACGNEAERTSLRRLLSGDE